ncbi:MAG: peptidase S8, partial [Candidatus Aureabacteria bacterium]|nr:peptidase S8 [Candidatus Auribacterota bacterium]
MKRIIFLFLVLSFIFTISAVAGDELFIKSSSFKANKYVPDQLVVKFKPGVGQDVINSINKKTGAKLIKVSKFADFNILKIPQGKTVKEMVEKYKKHVQVEYAEPNFIAHAHMVPNDSFYSPYQWHLDNSVYGGINMELAWDISTGYGVIVAVVDTGVAYEDYSEVIFLNRNKTKTIYYSQAPDLVGTDFVAGYDFVNDDAHPNDDEGHGTHVTGTIAQRTNNGIGVAGVAFDCSIMPVKVLDSSGSGTYTDIADGIYFAADNEADVINMSLGGSFDSSILKDAVAYAYGKGVTIVCSSGNDGASNSIGFPAAYDDYCIAVGATRYDEAISYYSNGGTSLDITAPGGDVTIDQNNDGYGDGV